MKKILLLLLSTFISATTFAQNADFFARSISLNQNGAITDVNGASNVSLGTFDGTSGILTLRGGAVKTWKNGGGNVCGPIMNYRIYPSATPAGAYTQQNLGFISEHPVAGNANPGDQTWGNTSLSIDLLNGKIDGTYTIEVYYQTTGHQSNPGNSGDCSETFYDGNGEANYKFNYTITNSPLPVVLSKFSGKAVERNIELNWETTSETNNDFFQVQKSTDLKSWESIGELKGKGSIDAKSNYQFIDQNPQTGVNHYYRLKQVDLNGQFEFSKSISVFMNSNPMLQVYPNPAVDLVKVTGIETPTTLQLIDSKGSIIDEKQISQNTEVEVSSKKAGIYFIRIFDQTSSQSKRIVVQ